MSRMVRTAGRSHASIGPTDGIAGRTGLRLRRSSVDRCGGSPTDGNTRDNARRNGPQEHPASLRGLAQAVTTQQFSHDHPRRGDGSSWLVSQLHALHCSQFSASQQPRRFRRRKRSAWPRSATAPALRLILRFMNIRRRPRRTICRLRLSPRHRLNRRRTTRSRFRTLRRPRVRRRLSRRRTAPPSSLNLPRRPTSTRNRRTSRRRRSHHRPCRRRRRPRPRRWRRT